MNLESFSSPRYSLEIEIGDTIGRIILKDSYSGVVFADGEYRYAAFAEYEGRIVRLEGLTDPTLEEEISERGERALVICGKLGTADIKPDLRVRHRIHLPEDAEYLDEYITVQNLSEKKVVLRSYRFGFRKRLERPQAYGGPGIDIENYRLVAVPFRLQPDGKKHDYQLDDIYYGRYVLSEMHNPMRLTADVVDRGRGRSEGWAWTDGENGLLIVKYNPDLIEYSMLETEHMGTEVYLNFGGAAPSLYNEPFESRGLEPGKRAAFGQTRYHFYEGLWRRGSYLFREFMNSMGHGRPDDYSPPIHWNELYDVGWHHNDPNALSENYNLATLEREATKAKEIGCEALYLDPGWEVCEGATRWDVSRLGEAQDFVRKMKAEYGLQVGFRTIGRSYCDEYPGMYRRTSDGLTGYYAPFAAKPFYEPCVCSRQYQEEKLKRIFSVADAGVSFIMFDEFDWRGQCFDPTHGHPVPTTPSMHAKAVVELVKEVHKRHPEILIETHDPVWPWGVRYTPVYYLHGAEGSFDEGWAFEFMWNPIEDLLEGRALCLFYYNLAYDIPLYLHINMENDNDNCLAFWWYASTCRHLGIGGKKNNQARFEAYKQAVAEYKALKELYTQGTFYGYDELTHIHVLPEAGKCVLNAFNLTDAPVSREVEVRLNDLGLIGDVTVEGAPYEVVGGKLVLSLSIPPFSPKIVKLVSRF